MTIHRLCPKCGEAERLARCLRVSFSSKASFTAAPVPLR